MKALVTGATGFIGSCLARSLVARGWEVSVLRRANSRLDALSDVPVRQHIGDITDAASLPPALAGIDGVFHAAATVSFWRGTRAEQYRVNVEGTRNVAAAALAAGVRRLVHTSSIAAIGVSPDGRPVDETFAFNGQPFDIGYLITKNLAEAEIKAAVARGLDAVIVNPATVLGPGDWNFHGGRMIRDLYHGKIPFYTGGGCAVVDVADVVQGHVAAFEKGRTGERYILAAENLSYQAMFETIAREVGRRPPYGRAPRFLVRLTGALADAWAGLVSRREPFLTRDLAVMGELFMYFDAAKAAREFGLTWIPFAESVRRTFRWYQENGLL